LLSGEGSDELLYGYLRFERTRRALQGVRDPQAVLRHLYFGGGIESSALVQRLTAGVAEGAEATAPWQWLKANLDMPLGDLQMLFSQRFRLQTLLQRQDRIGMAHGIEVRVPFLRPGFVAAANRMPQAMKYDCQTGTTKLALRIANDGVLPRRILTKAKDGFPSDMLLWLREKKIYDLAMILVQDSNGFSQNYLDGAEVRVLVEEHFAGRARQDTLVWNLLSLEIWHRMTNGEVI
jgi:asparagine synthetase B (glutamine-hydrolysing)